jgi:pilus assembly protein Flp/PilA
MHRVVRRFLDDESGASAIEYALIVTMIGVAIIFAAREAGLQISAVFNRLIEEMKVRA